MSFISIDTKRYKNGTCINSTMTAVIVDSKLGQIEVEAWSYAHAIVKVYSERNLSVAKNLALAIIWWSKCHRLTIDQVKLNWQHEDSFSVIPNWKQHIIERDRELEKLLPLL